MKKRIRAIVAAVLVVGAMIGLYLYADRVGGERAKKENKTLADKMLEKDLEKSYPPTPYAVAELYCGIVECLYRSDTKEEQIGELVKMERQFFDEEFAGINPYEDLLEATREEIATAEEKKLTFDGYVIEKASNIETWEKEGVSYAGVPVRFLYRTVDGSGSDYRKLILRKDKNKRYKILGWKTEEES